jgi:hypothetical protein
LATEAGFYSSIDASAHINVPPPRAGAIHLEYHPASQALAEDIVTALGSFMTGRATVQENEAADIGVVRLLVNGDPEFSPDGTVLFR